MAGETIKTKGIVLDIRPWSRTSHVVSWLTPDRGPVATVVKGAVRPKSAFLGQYDLFYTCDLIYYSRASGELHAIREVSPCAMRERLRGDFRATSLASYAAYLVKEHCPHNSEAAGWFAFLERSIDSLCRTGGGSRLPALVAIECGFLGLAGIFPDFSGADSSGDADAVQFAIDRGKVGEGGKTIRLPRAAAAIVESRGVACSNASDGDLSAAVRFLGLFIRYHLDMPSGIRRDVVRLIAQAGPRIPAQGSTMTRVPGFTSS